MGILDAVGGLVVELVKFVCKCIYPTIENSCRFSSKIENLREEMEKLTTFRDDIKGKVDVAEGAGYKPKPDVLKWIEDVCELENEWKTTMQESIAEAKTLAYKCCPKCILRSEVSTQAQNITDQLRTLIDDGKKFGSNLTVENYRMIKVEFFPGPSIEGQSAATSNLNELLRLLEDDKVCIIGVWGTGGVGKTTLVNNLNNELSKTNVSSSKLSFGVVIWVTVPKPPIDIRTIQTEIASRLKVENVGSVKRIASKIYQRLNEEKSFLLILDDVWEPIHLDDVGVPQPEKPARSKVIITSRFLDVCKKMKADTEMRVNTLDEDESWQLFVENAGDVAKREDIQSLAKDIAEECGGLPLAITVIGASLRGKTRVELWEDALRSLRMSEPHKDVQDKVYIVIKWSVESLKSQQHVNKRRGDIQNCFLYCSLYPADISTDHLIYSWWAEGFLGEHDTYKEAYNRGITMIDSLKNACLLEETEVEFWMPQQVDYVKMHDVVRDVAKWIDNSFGFTEIPNIEVSASVKRISLVSKISQSLPDNLTKCPETTSLLLQDNDTLEEISDGLLLQDNYSLEDGLIWQDKYSLEEIPDGFFLAFPALRVLNLSKTRIKALPSSINSLCQLRALILQNCPSLREFPRIGNLCNLQLLDCDNTCLCDLPQGMDKLTNLRLLNMPVYDFKESVGQGFFPKYPKIEIIIMPMCGKTDGFTTWIPLPKATVFGPTSLDEISSLPNLTSLFIRLDPSSNFNRDYTWMSRLKSFHIEIGEKSGGVPFNKTRKKISISHCEAFSNIELSGMLQFASDLLLVECKGLRELIMNKSFDGLKELQIKSCSCDFTPAEEGSGQFDPLPNLEYLSLESVNNLKCVSDFSQLLGLRFSKLHQLDIDYCDSLTCLFKVGGAFSVPKHLKGISIFGCEQLVELFVQCSSSQTTVVTSEIRGLSLVELSKLETFGEPESMWEHLEELTVAECSRLRKLPLSIQTSNNIKEIRGDSKGWSQLEWDDDNFKSNLERCFRQIY